MSTTLPWSLKGVSVEARQIARREAHARAMTVGAWLSAAIREAAAGAAISGSVRSADPTPTADTEAAKDREIARLRAEVMSLHDRLAALAAHETVRPAASASAFANEHRVASQR